MWDFKPLPDLDKLLPANSEHWELWTVNYTTPFGKVIRRPVRWLRACYTRMMTWVEPMQRNLDMVVPIHKASAPQARWEAETELPRWFNNHEKSCLDKAGETHVLMVSSDHHTCAMVCACLHTDATLSPLIYIYSSLIYQAGSIDIFLCVFPNPFSSYNSYGLIRRPDCPIL